jgi:hypothetical protein
LIRLEIVVLECGKKNDIIGLLLHKLATGKNSLLASCPKFFKFFYQSFTLKRMKKVLLIMAATLMIISSGNCQWIQRKYGVTDYNRLSMEQLNDALKKTKNKATIEFSFQH